MMTSLELIELLRDNHLITPQKFTTIENALKKTEVTASKLLRQMEDI